MKAKNRTVNDLNEWKITDSDQMKDRIHSEEEFKALFEQAIVEYDEALRTINSHIIEVKILLLNSRIGVQEYFRPFRRHFQDRFLFRLIAIDSRCNYTA